MLLTTYGCAGVVLRPAEPGRPEMVGAPDDYRRGIRAAALIRDLAGAAMIDFAKKARGEGATWSDLAEPLGVAQGMGDPAAAAFTVVAGPPREPAGPVTVAWTCESCLSRVIDEGPGAGRETGHQPDCDRYQP
ncbi:hypothetical protein [Amycolatopsis thermoflava]|uniref:hypothetical protein n=1 Tax=Amycolatopsis thermoflava TaxID=84480 RepID=UPI0038292819